MSSAFEPISHPLIQHKLSIMRNTDTSTAQFRRLLRELSQLLAYEATRDLPVTQVTMDTPLETMQTPMIAGKKMAVISILRAGNGMLDGVLELIPSARVGFVGLYRDETTLEPVQYYSKLPEAMSARQALLVDPMLATGNSAAAAVSLVKEAGCAQITFMCLLAAPEGIETLRAAHPDIKIIAASVDRCLNDHGYILPGLGDAGDRMFGTK